MIRGAPLARARSGRTLAGAKLKRASVICYPFPFGSATFLPEVEAFKEDHPARYNLGAGGAMSAMLAACPPRQVSASGTVLSLRPEKRSTDEP
jgi:hypothetical protein